MDNKIEVFGTAVTFTNQKPPPYNPLKRPPISYKKPIIFLSTYILAIVLLIVFLPKDLFVKKWIVIVAFSLIFALAIAKKAIIWLVHLYQNKASDKTRLKCVFEPSCSEYMILAIEKYGLFRGVIKGIKRLLRCHPPNGGKDYP